MINSVFTLHRGHRGRLMLRSFAKATNNRAVCDTARPFLAKLLPGRVCARAGVKACGMARSTAKVSSIESLPLFATDDAIGAALLGDDRVQEWRQIAPILEARGLPKVDHLMGGRYVRAVVAFFRGGGAVPLAPDGVEDFDGWKRKRKRPA
jgi:hypothetical protein